MYDRICRPITDPWTWKNCSPLSQNGTIISQIYSFIITKNWFIVPPFVSFMILLAKSLKISHMFIDLCNGWKCESWCQILTYEVLMKVQPDSIYGKLMPKLNLWGTNLDLIGQNRIRSIIKNVKVRSDI